MELSHHGILNQKWGVRNGQPYPLGGGDYTPSQIKAIREKRKSGNRIYNKKHFDEVLKADKTTLSTLSYDPSRTKGTDMFYATHDALDKHQYNALFNRPLPQSIYDEKGNFLGTETFMKYRINNGLRHDMKVLYRMFNYVIPYDGAGDARKGKDVATQRAKFFKACKEAGYGAGLDTNDAIYGGFKAKSPVIVFDMEQVIPKDVYRTKALDQNISRLALAGRKLFCL